MSNLWDKVAAQWQDVVNLALGIWLAVSPWVLSYAVEPTARWNALVLGVVIAVAAGAALVAFHKWEEWVNAAFAVWLIASPWILDFGALTTAVWNQVVVGVVVAVLAIWSSMTEHRPGPLATKS